MKWCICSVNIWIRTVKQKETFKRFCTKLKSCRGCALNRLPEVKSFIYDDLPEYTGVVFHPIPGAPPQLVLFNDAQEEIKRIDLAPLSRNDCKALLKDWGFKHADESEEMSDKARLEF